MVTIYYNGGSINVQEEDSTFRYRSIMGECYVTLNFQLNKAIDFPVGTYIVYQGRTYTLTSPEHWKRWGVHNIEYTLTLHGEQEALKKYKLRNLQDGRLKFPMMATPAEFLNLIVGNLNATGRESGWTGSCLFSAEAKQIEFNHAFLIDALTDIASKFETEFEITEDKEIRLGKVEYYKTDPLPLAYGKGNGFKPGTGRVNTDDSKPVEILYVQGGERNIDRSKYGSSELLLPKGQTLTYEGRQYVASSDGYYIKRADKQLQFKNEDSIDLSDIYPKREGVISRVVTVDAEKHFYDFEDSSIPASLDYNDCLIDGETLTVIFQTGMLAGREFEINKYIHVEDDGQGNEVAARRFEIVPAEMDGYVMPCTNFLPAVGDKYIIFNCMLPNSYIRDNEKQTGAEWDLFREAARFMYENEDFKFTFTGELQGKWAKENWATIGTRLVLGSYIRFTDDDFAPNGVDMRITGIKDFFNAPYAPVIEVSNGVMAAGFSSQLREPDHNEVRIGESYDRSIAFTKRRWRDARETMTALEEAMEANFQNFSQAINPIAVQTMQLLVGDESLQFRFVNSKVTPQEVSHQFTYNDNTKILSTEAGTIQHMTLGIGNMAASHQASEYKFWDMSAFSSSNLGGQYADKKYYLYAKCSKSAETGVFVLSETPIAMEGVTGYYHFLVGILNSEYEGSRSFVTLYGFTEILPGRITTDKIVSGSGLTYWDLVANILKLGDKLSYNLNGDGAFILNGPLVQTGAGTPTEVGAWCGEWKSNRTYKLGDEVWKAAADGTVSTYRYVNSVASSGHDVTDDDYWEVYAKGVKGDPGQDAESPVYADIDNEMEGVSLLSSGVVAADVTMQTTVSMWYGTTALSLLAISISGLPTGFSATYNINTGVITFTIARGSSVAATVPITINVSAKFGQVTYTRSLIFTVAGVKAGTDGSDGDDGNDAVIYSLQPSVSAVKKNKSGQYSVASVTCKKMKRVGQNGLAETSDGTLKYSIDGGSEQIYSSGISTSSFTSTLTFLYYISGVLVDKETIPLLIDGADGQNGQDGQDGDDGKGVYSTVIRYNTSSSGTTAPVSGWVDYIPAVNAGYYLWTRTVITYTDGTTSTSYSVARQGSDGTPGTNGTNGTDGKTPYIQNGYWYIDGVSTGVKAEGEDGAPGADGNSPYIYNGYWYINGVSTGVQAQGPQGAQGNIGPAMVFRGNYDSGVTYYGNSNRVDVVYYSSQNKYYVAKSTAGSFSGKTPTNTTYWNDFGASFDSIATGLLLAEEANIANFIFRNQTLVSQYGGLVMDGVNGIIKLGTLLKLTNQALSMMNPSGVEKIRLANESVGDWDISLLKASDDKTLSNNEVNVGAYIPSTGTNYDVTGTNVLKVNIGSLDVGDTVYCGTPTFSLTPSTIVHNQASAMVRFSGSAQLHVRLKKDGVLVSGKDYKGYSAGSQVSSGNSISIVFGTSLYTYTIPSGGRGNYTLEIGFDTGEWQVYSDNSSGSLTINTKLSVRYKFNKANFAKSIIGNDGILLTFGGGTASNSGYLLFNKDNFAVGFNQKLLLLNQNGLYKSTNGGQTLTAL